MEEENSSIPYIKFGESRACLSCFKFKQSSPKLTPEEAVVELSVKIDKLHMKIKNYEYKIKKLRRESKQAIVDKDRSMAVSMLQISVRYKNTRDKMIKIYTQLILIKNEIDQAATLGDITRNLGLANDLLTAQLEKLNIGAIDEMMLTMKENIDQSNEVSDALSTNVLPEYDVSDELKALEDEIADAIHMPDVIKKIEKNENIEKRKKESMLM